MSTLAKKLNDLKKLNLSNATVSLWVIQRYIRDKEAVYKVKWVDIEKNLATKLKRIVVDKIKERNEVKEYEYLSSDQDDGLIGIAAKETDFLSILDTIASGSSNEKVESFEELSRAWAYIIKIQHGSNSILGFKRIVKRGELKRASWYVNVTFRDKRFVDIEEEEIFRIEKTIDFFFYQDDLFILDKRDFEIGLNFREGMIRQRDSVLTEFDEQKVVDDVMQIRDFVGENLTFLRRLATINKNGFFRHPQFLAKLEEINKQENWGLSFANGALKIEEDNIELVLKVLNKDRLKDLIEGETFDVSVKKSVKVN